MHRSSPRPLDSTDSTTTRSFTHTESDPLWDLGEGFTMMIGANAAAIILEVG